jgi:hypothetical protein
MSSNSYVNKALAIIVASYPSVSNKEEIGQFLEIATKSLSKYPDSVIELLADPTRGIVTKCTFMPSIAEMVKFCDAEMDRRWSKAKHNAAISGEYLPPPIHDEEHRQKMRSKIIAEFAKLKSDLEATAKNGKLPFELRYGYVPERDFREGKLGWQLQREGKS